MLGSDDLDKESVCFLPHESMHESQFHSNLRVRSGQEKYFATIATFWLLTFVINNIIHPN